MNYLATILLSAASLWTVAACAAEVPSGTELSIRLTSKVSSQAPLPQTFGATLIAPVVLDGAVALPSGLTVAGSVKQARAAAPLAKALLELTFTTISDGKVTISLRAVVAALENARETLDANAVINGIDEGQSYGGRLNEGLAKLGANQKLAGIAGILQQTKQALKIGDVNANIEYEPGVELILKLTEPLVWTGAMQGPEAGIVPFPDEGALAKVVNEQPFRTVAAKPPRPSDITNLMFIGSEAQVREAFLKAGWAEPAALDAQSKLETARAMIENRGYKEGPMSLLLLAGDAPVMSWQKGNNTFASRHHLRVYRRPELFAGKEVWVSSSTHDTGIEFSERDRTFIHTVEAEIDRERAKVVTDLVCTGMVKSVALVDRPDVPTALENATGDALKTDGRMAVVLF